MRRALIIAGVLASILAVFSLIFVFAREDTKPLTSKELTRKSDSFGDFVEFQTESGLKREYLTPLKAEPFAPAPKPTGLNVPQTPKPEELAFLASMVANNKVKVDWVTIANPTKHEIARFLIVAEGMLVIPISKDYSPPPGTRVMVYTYSGTSQEKGTLAVLEPEDFTKRTSLRLWYFNNSYKGTKLIPSSSW